MLNLCAYGFTGISTKSRRQWRVNVGTQIKGKGKEHDKGQTNKEAVRNNSTENRIIPDWLARPHNDKEFTYTQQALY